MPALRSLLLALVLLVALPSGASAIVPAGFQETTAFSGLVNPTSVRFAADGRVFVAEKRGRVLQYDSLSDPTPTVYADLSTAVHDFWDRGLLGMALDPDFTNGRPYIYVLYTYNKDPSNPTVPRWGDNCPTPPGATGDGCVVSGRLSRLGPGGVETPLITDWCQQYPSHSIGDLVFGPGRALYVSAGDGASFNFADYGQDGDPVNPCGDPPGGTISPPTAEGGALRSQDVRTAGDATGGDGAILRVDPDTGAALPDNPAAGSADAMTRRIVAHGFRNPFRLTIRPGTGELWAGDVGWNEWEEVDRIATPTAAVGNYGWPCYEGAGRMASYDNLNLNLCESLYSQGAGAHAAPHYTYRHADKVIAGEACPSGTSSIAGLAFYTGSSFPARYRDGLFFADYSRSCIWFMPVGTNGLPDPSRRESFASGAVGVVNLVQGPDGSLYYPDLNNGAVRRISYGAPNAAPTARATATPSSGAVPLSVQFDGTTSSDPNGDALTYAWDLDGDGAYDDATGSRPTWTYTTAAVVTARLRVTDPGGQEGTTTVTITAGSRPAARIDTPAAGTTWAVGNQLGFSGGGTDWQGGALPASGLSWKLLLQHCGAGGQDCHTHTVQTWTGAASGTFVAPDHEYPSYLELELTATDASGLTDTRHATARPADRRPHVRDGARRPRAVGRLVHGCGAVHADRHPGLHAGAQRTGAADARRPDLRVHRLVGRRRPDPRDHRAGERRHLPRDVLRVLGPGGPRGRVGLRRGERRAGARRLGARQRGHGGRGHAHDVRALRRGADVRRARRLGHGRRRGVARPHDRHDPGGLGQSDGARHELADGGDQGSARRAQLRALRGRGQQPRKRACDHDGGVRRAQPGRGRAERVDAPGDDVRRHDAAALRQRRARHEPGGQRADRGEHGRAALRRQRRLARVLPGPARRDPPLQPGADRGRGGDRHDDAGRVGRPAGAAARRRPGQPDVHRDAGRGEPGGQDAGRDQRGQRHAVVHGVRRRGVAVGHAGERLGAPGPHGQREPRRSRAGHLQRDRHRDGRGRAGLAGDRARDADRERATAAAGARGVARVARVRRDRRRERAGR